MGHRLSTPEQAISLNDLLATPTGTSSSSSPAHANLAVAWRLPNGSPVALRQMLPFTDRDAIVALRIYDSKRLRTEPPPSLNAAALSLCSSGAANLNSSNTTIPLNVAQQTLTLSNGVVVDYRIFVWTGRNLSDNDLCAAETMGFELVLALGSAANGPAIIERLWNATSYVPFPESPNNVDVSDHPVYIAICGNPQRQNTNGINRKETLQLDLAGITPVSLEGPLAAIPTDDRKQHLFRSGLSEEQQKLAQLEHYAPQSSLIEPNLFLSGVAVSTDLNHLTSRGITHIVNTALDACRNEFPEKFTYLGLRLTDSKHEDIMCRVYDVIEFIETALSKPHHKVLVHCHRGISRSATMVIAYLMLKRGISFNEAFDFVKSRRDIISPNVGFAVALLHWQNRMQFGAVDAPIIYRITSFSPTRDPLCIVGKLADLDTRIDTRGVYVFHTSSAMYVWIGKRSQRLLYVYARQTLVPRLQRFERGPNSTIDVHDGFEPPEFLSLFGERKAPVFAGCVADYDDEYKALVLPLPDLLEKAPTELRSGSVSHRPTSTTPPVVLPAASHSERDHVDSGPLVIAGEESGFAVFYSWPRLQEIEVFGPEDLNDSGVFVFVKRKAKSRSAKLFIWAGAEVDVGPDLNEFVGAIAKDCISRLGMQRLETTIMYEEAGEESDEFWDLF